MTEPLLTERWHDAPTRRAAPRQHYGRLAPATVRLAHALTTAEAAARLGCSDRSVRQLIQRNRLDALIFEGQYWVPLASLEQYEAVRVKRGPRRKAVG